MTRRVLVVGGAGAFGRRLAQGLAATGGFAIIIAGRDPGRAGEAAAELRRTFPGCTIEAVAIDRDRVTAADLRRLCPFAVVDAAGPFRAGAYTLAKAAIDAGVHYLDLADDRGFVAGFPALDEAAKRAGVVAASGASSTPALSHAVLERMTEGWTAVDTVEIAISPGNRAPRGLSVVRSILSYAGRPVPLLLDGQWQMRPGWGLLVLCPLPGLGRRWLSLCNTPDLDLVPARFGVRGSAIFRAGLELSVLHLGLWLSALPVRAGMLRSLEPLARPLRAAADRLRGMGTDRGGMLVGVTGRDCAMQPARARWMLLAEAGDGPAVPTLPAVAMIRRLADGEPIRPGARACVGMLTLGEIEAEFARCRISTSIEGGRAGPSLFARALGGAFETLPEVIRSAHSPGHWLALSGTARVDGPRNVVGRILAQAFGLPPGSEDTPVRVTFRACNDGEIWTRDFGGRRFSSELRARPGGGLTERFGPFTFDLDVPAGPDGLSMRIASWRVGRLPLPRAMMPRTRAGETLDACGRFSFDVEISLPLVGRLAHYHGWLVPETRSTPPSP